MNYRMKKKIIKTKKKERLNRNDEKNFRTDSEAFIKKKKLERE